MTTSPPFQLSSLLGGRDVAVAADRLASLLPAELDPLARLAYNYRWSWHPDGDALFRAVDEHGWELSGRNPVRLLADLTPEAAEAAAADAGLRERTDRVAAVVEADLARPARRVDGLGGPVAFFCAEFGVHSSLPIYSGGLGVLAGDVLKEASDRGYPYIGIGLLYRRGYFQQRVDRRGLQHEYWLQLVPERTPAVLVTGGDGAALELTFTVFGREVAFRVWRVDVGRVPLFLLDTELPRNDPTQRWITSRLYEGNSATRLGQYGLLGIGGLRLLRALAVEPGVLHFNEGHPALAALELAAEYVAYGMPFDQAFERVRALCVFTTHTPVPAGNESYPPEQFLEAYGDLADRLHIAPGRLLELCRSSLPDDIWPGMTPLALRASRRANGVSRRHGDVARKMWQPLFGTASPTETPITYVTNGVHVPTFLAAPLRSLLDRYLGEGWLDRAADPAAWAAVDRIPNSELWEARCRARAELVEYVRVKSVQDRLQRGEELDYVSASARDFTTEALTLGFARRIATYKRLFLLAADPQRASALLTRAQPVQLLIAGKAHPLDENAKGMLTALFELKDTAGFAGRVAFLENYDLSVALPVVSGCDVWINLPRPPLEASGTSGMKATLNGGLNVSVLDGWWAEAYDGSNGWAIDGDVDDDHQAQDARHGAALYDLLEREVIPLFYERDAQGVPHGWCERVKASLKTNGPSFCAARMLEGYVESVYRPDATA
jgi:glycogen phosphorylase